MNQRKYKSIILTGGSGKLGKAIINSGLFPNIIAPAKKEFDLTQRESLQRFLDQNDFDAVINCAALARMTECESNPTRAVETNIIGTGNLVNEIFRSGRKIRFIHISTDGVYKSVDGNYKEEDVTIPYNIYGWTKLGAECVVNTLPDFCIIRTRFFDPENIPFESSATDIYTSSIPVDFLAKAISVLLESDFKGTINVGEERVSDYERYKKFKPSLSKCLRKDVVKELNCEIAYDASLNIERWSNIEKEYYAKL